MGNPRCSGAFIQSKHGARGNFEFVFPAPSGGGLAHVWRNNDDGALPWVGYNCFGGRGADDVALIQSNFGAGVGDLEAVTRDGGRLDAYWRDDNTFQWHGPTVIATGVAGTPALFQSNHGSKGNFELVVPWSGGGLAHFWRNNDDPNFPWFGPTLFGEGNVSGAAMIQSNFDGHLELVVCNGARLDFYFRDSSFNWQGPFPFAENVTGTPALIQGVHGSKGNFEVVVPAADGGLLHFWRDNNASGLPWHGPQRSGSARYSHASLVQSNFGSPGHLEVIAREGSRWAFFWRDDNFAWNGPFPLGIERSFRVSECTFNWTAAFLQEWTHITVRIQLNPDAGISAGTMNTLRNTWRTGIVNKWSNRFSCERPGAGAPRRALTFDVQWVGSGAHQVVRVRTGPNQSVMRLWDTADTGDVVSHEFGHMIGWPDEYATAACPTRNPVNTGTVMDDNTEVVERLTEPFCNFLCAQDAVPV